MKGTLVIYDSFFGNTRLIAETIGKGLDLPEKVKVIKVQDVLPEDIANIDLLIVGSPTRKFYPSPDVKRFLNNIPRKVLQGIKVAGFDTRVTEEDVEKIKILSFFVKIFGYAAKTITGKLQKKGGELILPPEGFYVSGMEGPLVQGEIERAGRWAGKIISAISSSPSESNTSMKKS